MTLYQTRDTLAEEDEEDVSLLEEAAQMTTRMRTKTGRSPWQRLVWRAPDARPS